MKTNKQFDGAARGRVGVSPSAPQPFHSGWVTVIPTEAQGNRVTNEQDYEPP
jgi:hypothetical protein